MVGFRTHLRRLSVLALAWFVMAVGAASATPWAKPLELQSVCSADGTTYVISAQYDDDATHHSVDCVLCILLAPPLGQATSTALLDRTPEIRAVATSQLEISLRSSAPLPARGPPLRT